jgi:acyl-coenzyme A synthetase/AMP-(fatty) acid ligase/3-hydroxymyristoyl/3-hydroxydecanoyl-(acyl carrier protein) dehydratase
MNAAPLIAGFAPGAVVGAREGSELGVGEFLAAVGALAAKLPDAECAMLLCGDRLAFSIGFAALLRRRIAALLPPSHASQALARIVAAKKPAFALVDRFGVAPGVPEIVVGDSLPSMQDENVPAIDTAQVAIIAYTSGTTGEPQPHVKRWGSLVAAASAMRERIGVDAGQAIVSAVPPQHMWGLEASVMLPLRSGGIVHASQPLLPEDVVAAMSQLTAPCWLVTTPLHIRTLMRSQVALPRLAGVLTATTPLDRALAVEFERRFATGILEIYGSTETGTIATRRPSSESAFTPLPDIAITPREKGLAVRGGHLPAEIVLSDRGVAESDGRFTLAGRDADMVKVGGKRASLAMLEHELRAVPGVIDGAFATMEEGGPTPRLAALAVAPGIEAAAIVAALRERIDAVFLPRPLHLVEVLPRNALGKLSASAVRERIAALSSAMRASHPHETRFVVPPSHPALPGHFPGRPIVPAAWLMTLVADACRDAFGVSTVVTGIANARFRAPLPPGVQIEVELRTPDAGRVAFTCSAGETRIADGVLTIDKGDVQ